MTPLRLLLIAVALCSHGCIKTEIDKCHEVREYQAAEPGPLLRVPDGLEDLNDEERLAVPYGRANVEATPKDQPCLIEPPSYSDRISD